MSSSPATSPSSPENERESTGKPCSTSIPSSTAKIIAIAESFKRRKEDRADVKKLDALIAPEFDKACDAYIRVKKIKADELAERMGVDETYLSNMRSGVKPIALRHTIPLRDCQEAVEALVQPACADVGLAVVSRTRLTRARLLDCALRYLLESGPLLKSFVRETAQWEAVDEAEVRAALGEP